MRLSAVLVMSVLCCAPAFAKTTIQAGWRPGELKIGAPDEQWQGAMTDLDGTTLSVGAKNDGEAVCVRIVAADPGMARRVAFRGLLLEIDAKGEKPFRVEYPVSPFSEGGPPPAARVEQEGAPHGRPPGSRNDVLVVLDPSSGQRQSIPVQNDLGLEARTTSEGTRFVYEIKIPLARTATHPYAVGAAPGAKLSLSVDSPKLDPSLLPQGGGGGGWGGRGGGMRGGRGGMGGEGGEPGAGGGGPGGGAGPGAGEGPGGGGGSGGGEGSGGGRGGGGRRGGGGGRGPGGGGDESSFSPPKPLRFKVEVQLANAPAAPAPAAGK